MKRQVIDELDCFVKHLKTKSSDSSSLPSFQYIEGEKLHELCLWWSTANFFAYPFPVDVIRKIFSHLSAQEYFRYAHGLCSRMRKYAFEDIRILRVVLVWGRKKTCETFNFHYTKMFMLDGLKLGRPAPGFCYKNYAQRKVNIFVYLVVTEKIMLTLSGGKQLIHDYKTIAIGPSSGVKTYWISPGFQGLIKRDDQDPAKTSYFSHITIDTK